MPRKKNMQVSKQDYLKAIKSLFGEFEDADVKKASGDIGFDDVKAQMNNILKGIEAVKGDTISLDYLEEEFNKLSVFNKEYIKQHTDPSYGGVFQGKLNAKQLKRRNIVHKFESFCEFIREGHQNPEEFKDRFVRDVFTYENADSMDTIENDLVEKVALDPSTVLNEAEMQQLAEIINKSPEFSSSKNIPEELKMGGSLEDLEAFKASNPGLSKSDLKYINGRIAAEKFYSNLKAKRPIAKPQPPVTKADGTIMLENIHQDDFQSTRNGCYSCAMRLMLQSRGLNLTQAQIRAYRETETQAQFDHVLGDNMGDIIDLGGIITKCLPNTAMVQRRYYGNTIASKEQKKQILEDLKKTIKDGLLVHHSPIALLCGNHYRTIVGYNEKTGTITLKNSMGIPPLDPNRNTEIKIEDLLKESKLTLSHMVTIDPQNPSRGIEEDAHDLEFVNGFYQDNRDLPIGTLQKEANPNVIPYGGNLKLGNLDVYISSEMKLPGTLVFPDKVKEADRQGDKILPLSESPEKQKLLEALKEKMDSIYPPNSQIAFGKKSSNKRNAVIHVAKPQEDGTIITEESSFDEYKVYAYCHNLIKKIDQLTPKQVKFALDPRTIALRSVPIDLYAERGLEFVAGKGFSPQEVADICDAAEYVAGVRKTYKKKGIEEFQQKKQELEKQTEGRDKTPAERVMAGFIDAVIKEKQPKEVEAGANEKKQEPEKKEPAKEAPKKEEPKPEAPKAEAPKAKGTDNEAVKAFILKQVGDAIGRELGADDFNEIVYNGYVTCGDDSVRNNLFIKGEGRDPLADIRTAMDAGGKIFLNLPDREYFVMDVFELNVKGNEPKLEVPLYEHQKMTQAIQEIAKRINATGTTLGDSKEFKAFRTKLNELANGELPKDRHAFYDSLNDVVNKAFDYTMAKLDQSMNQRRDTRFTEASNLMEIYRAVCTHEKPSPNNLNLSIIAAKYMKVKLNEDLKSKNPAVKGRAQEILGDKQKFLKAYEELRDKQAFKSMFNNLTEDEVKRFAHQDAHAIHNQLVQSIGQPSIEQSKVEQQINI